METHSDKLFSYVLTVSRFPQLRYNDSRFLFSIPAFAIVAGGQQQINIRVIAQRGPERSDNAEGLQGLKKRVNFMSEPVCHLSSASPRLGEARQ